MKSRLDQITVAEFIELLCGHADILLNKNEEVGEAEVLHTAKEIVEKYKSIVDPSGSKAFVVRESRTSRRSIRIMFLRLCAAMLRLGAVEEVRGMLSEYGWDVDGRDAEYLSRKCEKEFKRLEAEEKREEDKKKPEEESEDSKSEEAIRARFSSEVAFLITYYKTPINIREMTVDVYANIVARANREIKALNAKSKKK